MTATLDAAPPAVGPLVAVLDQLGELVDALTDDQYTRAPAAAGSAIGGHVRHNLDHIDALLRGLRSGTLNYDHRDRGTAVERDCHAAAAAVHRLQDELFDFPWETAPTSLRLTALVAPDLPPATALTTPERELMFVLSHTIHHNALIAVLARLVGAEPPPGFGYAPATVAHLRSRPCVR